MTTPKPDPAPLAASAGRPIEHLERVDPARVELGQWYWVKKKGDDDEWLGCVMEVGSNYVALHAPHGDRGYSAVRIHQDQLHECLRPEPNAEAVIKARIDHHQQEVKRYLEEVKSLTARLGVGNHTALEDASAGSGRGLATLTSRRDVKAYERALVRARDKQLPDLFKAIREANESLATWMTAESMPLKALAGRLEDSLAGVKDRIFNVSLYAGLTEEIVQIADGAPAEITEKLRVFQRQAYADEECLLSYETGGMSFSDIAAFDAWLARPDNRNRILPFPRCIVAMRVRRHEKKREWYGRIFDLFINVELGELDKLTFLYIRNGERLYRLNCDLEFGELIFPSKAAFDPQEPMMVEMFGGSVDRMMPLREYEDLVQEQDKLRAKATQWEAENPKAPWGSNPYWDRTGFQRERWVPFNRASVYYDDALKEIAEEVRQYNRIALIIQGLFDRSDVLHPHPPVKGWTGESFSGAIELVYDGEATLYAGEEPDFETYRAQCNDALSADSIVCGQEDYWERKEAEKESRRMDRDYRRRGHGSDWRPERYRPSGNPGPGLLAKMESWQPRMRKAVFSWYREGRGYNEQVRTTLTVPASELLNVSAYKPGDYKQFFRDPRSRAKYLQWAPLLLAAEEYHAGVRTAREPEQ